VAEASPIDGPAFCPECGAALVVAERAPRCPDCGYFRFRNPVPGVAVVVQDEHGRVLLGRRAFGRYAGLWCIPCGVLEWGEDVRDGARREFLEETGLDVRVREVIAAHSTHHAPVVVAGRSYPERWAVGIWFRGEPVGGYLHPADGELSALEFVDPAAPPPLAFPADALVLAQLLAGAGRVSG
jgi:ADP-ribose pyrophosphatase YjhB (NUDIX family)